MDGTTRWLSTSGQLSCPSHTRWHRANRPDNRSLDIRGRVGGVATGRVTPPVGFVLRPAIRQRCVPDRASGSSRSHPPPHQVGWRLIELSAPRSHGSAGSKSNPFVLDWRNLDQIDAQYDYVMCRGNSVVYASTWTGGGQVATRSGVCRYLEEGSPGTTGRLPSRRCASQPRRGQLPVPVGRLEPRRGTNAPTELTSERPSWGVIVARKPN